jgi:hypothetical protein
MKNGDLRRRVEYRLGGREAPTLFAGSFATMREAKTLQGWILGEIAARRVPDLRSLAVEASEAPTLEVAGERWSASRFDVAESTRTQQRVSLKLALPMLGTRRVDELEAQDVAALVADLFEKGKAPGTIRKTVQAVAMVLDHAGVKPNPARDRRRRQASARGAGGDKPADRRSRRRRLSTASGASPARAPVPRLERRARRGDRPHARRGLRRDATSRPASRFDDEGAAGALDRPPGRPRGRARGDASASPLPRSGGAPVRGQRSGRAEDGDREGVSRGRRSDVLASRPPPSAD